MLDFSPVTVYARALVLPLPPEEAERRRDVQAEAVALKVTREYEQPWARSSKMSPTRTRRWATTCVRTARMGMSSTSK